MLKLTKKVEYALISLVHISKQEDNVNSSAKQIADKYFIPGEILAKILQQLASLDMIRSIKGPKGGYQLSCDINNINRKPQPGYWAGYEELEDEGMDMEQDEEEVTADEEYISDGGDD